LRAPTFRHNPGKVVKADLRDGPEKNKFEGGDGKKAQESTPAHQGWKNLGDRGLASGPKTLTGTNGARGGGYSTSCFNWRGPSNVGVAWWPRGLRRGGEK